MGHTGTVRVSLGLHTTQADIDATLCALKLAWHLHIPAGYNAQVTPSTSCDAALA
jgi:hypothetical protein